MMKTLDLRNTPMIRKVALPLSKSECNRWLVLASLFPGKVKLRRVSDAEDTQRLRDLLRDLKAGFFDCGPAGTVFRFITARLAVEPGIHLVTGSDRLRERPIRPLVDALRSLGAQIEYTEREGYAPLEITGSPLRGGKVMVQNQESSQFVSALMLIAPFLPDGLTIQLFHPGVSAPYIYMTASILEKMGVAVQIQGSVITVSAVSDLKTEVVETEPESDWSAASYFYGTALLSQSAELYLPGLYNPSFQGDALVSDFFAPLGIQTVYTGAGVRIFHHGDVRRLDKPLRFNLSGTPDLAQTLIVAFSAFNQSFEFRGLHTLRLKETDRLHAIKTEMEKVGISLEITDDSCCYRGGDALKEPEVPFATYQDHRMAMSLAMLATKFPVTIENPDVVGKSFPGFWQELA
jgi:3-phosphoshikimate 1-carboxyvinyltransferase